MSSNWIETLGWTLLNSVWQGAIAALLIIVILRLLPVRVAKARYAIACTGIAAVFIMSIVTFVTLQKRITVESSSISYLLTSSASFTATGQQSESSYLNDALINLRQVVDQNMSLIVFVWCVGSILFSLRLAGGWWFVSRLKSDALEIENNWSNELQRLASQIGIEKAIRLAESKRITTPMVLGFIKPVILVPAGMLSGLTTAEIETIFLHELAHIRRHDYLINIAQAFIETLFFFNPFVWIISSIVRREREYCCDDEVIRIHGSSRTYANALAQLEEWKLTQSTFALALAANKNQLLNRIKRIMEKTGQKYSVKDRFIPAALLIVGLVCASWLTVQKKQESSNLENNSISQDTTKKSKSSRTTIITFDENGDAHEQIFEESDGDHFAWAPPTAMPPDFEMPAVPAVPAVPSFPSFPSFPAFPAVPADVWGSSRNFHDTIPGAWMRHGKNWEEFSKEFEKKFSEEFSDFYKKHEKDFDKMMKEMELRFKEDFEHGEFHGQLMETQRLHELAELDALAAQEHVNLSELQLAEVEALTHLSELNVPMIASLDELSSDLVDLEGNLTVLHGQVELFETELKEMLVKDGYLKKDEKINSISWSDDNIEVNGKRIKNSDAKKYHEKHDKLFNARFHIPKIE